MSERWRPKQLYRDARRGVDTDGVRYRDRAHDGEVNAGSALAARLHMQHKRRLLGATTVIDCIHNVPWLDCMRCSTRKVP